jgi:hypothetical protein
MDKYRLSSIPIKVYSTTDDFKYRMTYSLNKSDNIYLNDEISTRLGIALTEPITDPRAKTKSGGYQYDKHLFYVLENIDRIKL